MQRRNAWQSLTCLFMTFDQQQIQDGRIIYIAAAILATLFILPSVLLNGLLIRSLGTSSTLRKPSSLLLYSLAISNLLMGAVLLSAIAVDRYFIVHWGIQYSNRVTQRRMSDTVILIWVSSVVISKAQLYLPRTLTFPAAGSGMAICVVITTASYFRILITLRKRKMEVRNLNEVSLGHQSGNVERYGKSAVTMLFAYVVFILCYLPYLCTVVVGSILGESFTGIGSAESIVTTITYLKSTINPLILFWRIKEIQNAARITIHSALTSIKGNNKKTNRVGTVTSSNYEKTTRQETA